MFLELLADYGLFFAKVATIVVAIGIIVGLIVSASGKSPEEKSGRLEVKKINDKLDHLRAVLREAVLDREAFKQQAKVERKQQKNEAKAAKKAAKQLSKSTEQAAADAEQGDGEQPENVYVLDFDGDMRASAVEQFREEITAVLTMATAKDEIVLRLESPGGMVHAYGLAASQLARIRSAQVPLTVCIDKVAASGGYMMACIGDKLLAAPFAVIGSIGVVAGIPNFNKVLKKYDVDYELLTAGEYKRTLTMLGENTEQGRKKFVQDLEETHELFKGFVEQYRPQLDIVSVATGETWYGNRAIEQSLVDQISTSDDYLTGLAKHASVYELRYVQKKNWQDRLGIAAQSAMEKSIDKFLLRTVNSWDTRH